MLANWIPDRLTPCGFSDAAVSMRAVLRNRLGSEPRREVLALALGKCALETGHWVSMHHFNLGNVKAGEQYIGNYCTFPLNEVINGKVVWFSPRGRLDRKGGTVVAEHYEDPPGHPQTRMRAYANLTEGTEAYVSFVAGGRYAVAWGKLLAGDAVAYVAELRAKGYFTASLEDYTKGVVSLQKQFVTKLERLEANDTPLPTVPPTAAVNAVADLRAAATKALGMTDVVGLPGQNLKRFTSEDDDPDSGPSVA